MSRATLFALLLCSNAFASPGLLSAELNPSSSEGGSVAAAADMRGWAGLQLHGLYRPSAAPWSLGLELDLPLLLWARGAGLDTMGFAARFTAVPVRAGSFELGTDAALTGWVQASNTGTFGTMGVRLSAFPGVRLGRVFVGLELAWEQPLFTALARSTIVTEAFDGRPVGPSVWAFPFTRFHTGLHVSVSLSSHFALFGGAGLIWTPNSLGVGPFDPMMFGFWPFSATVGVLARF
jgi:hypothetical protein